MEGIPVSQKTVLVAVVIAVLVLGSGALLLVKNASKNQPNTEAQMSMNNTQQSTSSTKSTTPIATDAVAIQDFAFSPANITVKKGTTVTWTNKDSAPHTVTVSSDTDPNSGASAGPSSESISFGKTYSYTFNGTGTFSYHCNFHQNMTGTVTVTD